MPQPTQSPHDQSAPLRLTSTTAPSKIFTSRSELAEHYKSDWHRYNLKRREAGLPLLKEEDFKARLEAALALRKEREGREERSGTDHLKKGAGGKKDKGKKKGTKDGKRGGRKLRDGNGDRDSGVVAVSQAPAWDQMKNGKTTKERKEEGGSEGGEVTEPMEHESTTTTTESMEEEPPVIDPRQDLFSSHTSDTVASNVQYMSVRYGFFIPDNEYLIDLEGLVGYCAEKVKLGHYCLYCQKVFRTWSGCQKHMVSTRHTKLRYERGVDMEEFDPFYDFAEADAEFLGTVMQKRQKSETSERSNEFVVVEGDDDDNESGEWEDISDDEEMDDANSKNAPDDDDDDGLYAAYQDEIARHGFDVTPLGELIFPDGRIVGHRGLARYYKQRFAPDNSDRDAVVAARRAAGERVYNGRVYNLRPESVDSVPSGETALTLAKAGLAVGAVQGRSGKGILVPSGAGGRAGFTALSLYRYKAVMKKARRDEHRGRRLQQRTEMNTNRMDKKANRLMNGVSVAHAPR